MNVRCALLALLSDGATYGLQLRDEFESRTGEVWPLNVGQVYQTLQRPERDARCAVDDTGADGPQRLYRITRARRRELEEWLVTPPDLSAPARDEIVMKVLVATEIHGVDVRAMTQAAPDPRGVAARDRARPHRGPGRHGARGRGGGLAVDRDA